MDDNKGPKISTKKSRKVGKKQTIGRKQQRAEEILTQTFSLDDSLSRISANCQTFEEHCDSLDFEDRSNKKVSDLSAKSFLESSETVDSADSTSLSIMSDSQSQLTKHHVTKQHQKELKTGQKRQKSNWKANLANKILLEHFEENNKDNSENAELGIKDVKVGYSGKEALTQSAVAAVEPGSEALFKMNEDTTFEKSVDISKKSENPSDQVFTDMSTSAENKPINVEQTAVSNSKDIPVLMAITTELLDIKPKINPTSVLHKKQELLTILNKIIACSGFDRHEILTCLNNSEQDNEIFSTNSSWPSAFVPSISAYDNSGHAYVERCADASIQVELCGCSHFVEFLGASVHEKLDRKSSEMNDVSLVGTADVTLAEIEKTAVLFSASLCDRVETSRKSMSSDWIETHDSLSQSFSRFNIHSDDSVIPMSEYLSPLASNPLNDTIIYSPKIIATADHIICDINNDVIELEKSDSEELNEEKGCKNCSLQVSLSYDNSFNSELESDLKIDVMKSSRKNSEEDEDGLKCKEDCVMNCSLQVSLSYDNSINSEIESDTKTDVMKNSGYNSEEDEDGFKCKEDRVRNCSLQVSLLHDNSINSEIESDMKTDVVKNSGNNSEEDEDGFKCKEDHVRNCSLQVSLLHDNSINSEIESDLKMDVMKSSRKNSEEDEDGLKCKEDCIRNCSLQVSFSYDNSFNSEMESDLKTDVMKNSEEDENCVMNCSLQVSLSCDDSLNSKMENDLKMDAIKSSGNNAAEDEDGLKCKEDCVLVIPESPESNISPNPSRPERSVSDKEIQLIENAELLTVENDSLDSSVFSLPCDADLQVSLSSDQCSQWRGELEGQVTSSSEFLSSGKDPCFPESLLHKPNTTSQIFVVSSDNEFSAVTPVKAELPTTLDANYQQSPDSSVKTDVVNIMFSTCVKESNGMMFVTEDISPVTPKSQTQLKQKHEKRVSLCWLDQHKIPSNTYKSAYEDRVLPTSLDSSENDSDEKWETAHLDEDELSFLAESPLDEPNEICLNKDHDSSVANASDSSADNSGVFEKFLSTTKLPQKPTKSMTSLADFIVDDDAEEEQEYDRSSDDYGNSDEDDEGASAFNCKGKKYDNDLENLSSRIDKVLDLDLMSDDDLENFPPPSSHVKKNSYKTPTSLQQILNATKLRQKPTKSVSSLADFMVDDDAEEEQEYDKSPDDDCDNSDEDDARASAVNCKEKKYLENLSSQVDAVLDLTSDDDLENFPPPSSHIKKKFYKTPTSSRQKHVLEVEDKNETFHTPAFTSFKKRALSDITEPVIPKPSEYVAHKILHAPYTVAHGARSESYGFLKSLSTDVKSYLRDIRARRYVDNFKAMRNELTTELFDLYNRTVFDMRIPSDTKVIWNDLLTKTAGYCRQMKSKDNPPKRIVRIELSVKVCDTADRLRDTLIHEMCHAIVWLVHGNREESHGTIWKTWAHIANGVHPDLPTITRCHTYKINTKYIYRCTKCGYEIGRHSKSLDISVKVCGRCRGRFELLVRKLTGSNSSIATPSVPRTPNKFALFVKENYGEIKKNHPGSTHKDIMLAITERYQARK